MTKDDVQSLLGIAAAIVAAGVVCAAGSHQGALLAGVPLLVWCTGIAFGVQWLAFIPAYLSQTEHYFDLIGSITYLSVVAFAIALNGPIDTRAALIGVLVAIWAIRLGSFLFVRVRAQGFDRRFSKLKTSVPAFLMTWTLQGLWVFLTLAAALAALTSFARAPLGWIEAIGALLWVGGFAIEVVADTQKRAFRADPANAATFIRHGLWARSRHPNYFGEIMLWTGITLIAAPVLQGWQWLTLISPLFVYVLLTRISGIPLLERRADKKWAEDAEYQAYKASTPSLMLRLSS